MHRAGVDDWGRGRDELHPAFRAAAFLGPDDFGVHGADVDNGALRDAHVHFGDKRDRLVRRGRQVGGDPFSLSHHLRVFAQDLELVCERLRNAVFGDRDSGKQIGALRRVVLEPNRSWLVEKHIDYGALRRR